MKKVLIFLIVVFISSCNSDDELTIELNEYDLEVISYFKEIALGFEHGEVSEITRKWNSTMKIFIGGNSVILAKKSVFIFLIFLDHLGCK